MIFLHQSIMNRQTEYHHKRRHHSHLRHHHKKIRLKKMIVYLLPIIIVCAGIAALINSGSTNFITSAGNVIIYGIIIVFFPIILIFYLCRLFADWIFEFFSFLYTLITGKRHQINCKNTVSNRNWLIHINYEEQEKTFQTYVDDSSI